MDANENIYRKQIGKILTSEEGLAMKEVVGEFTGQKLGAAFFRGTEPIERDMGNLRRGGHKRLCHAGRVRRWRSLSVCH